jgi:diguanylate cyclase (GGDEF)-like protein
MSGRVTRGGLVLGGILLIALADFFSGVEVRTFPLYYAPISVAAWYFGRAGSVAAASLCALAWFESNQLAGMQFSDPAIWVANTIVQGASFAIVGLLVASLKLALSRERALSRIDPLCCLLNSRAFYEDSDRLLALCRRGKRPVTLAYLDLDNFKAVNDAFGHKAGDNLLRAVAQVLQSSVRSSDLAARLGGDEFAMLLPELGPDEARQTLERLRAALSQLSPDPSCAVTASVGAVTFMVAPDDAEAMVQMADSAMYSAKEGGKNRVHLQLIDRDVAMAESCPPPDAQVQRTSKAG